mmetsp:Transcript_40227/g.54719  ORF Transcript_40227/g.54719 Transcript_40227/m.54719 type:complete len:254 (-) Transcript_40227:77-838(-)
MGILFIGLGDDESDIFSRVSFSFNLLMGALYLPIMEVLFVFLEDSLTLRKDLLAKAHHPVSYYIAKILSVTPVLAILLVLITMSTYTLGFYKYGSVQQFLAVMAAQFVVGNVFASLGICIASFVKNPAYLMSVTMICLVWLFAFSGFFVPIGSIMPGLRWMVHINPASYGFALFFQCILTVGRTVDFSCSDQSNYDTCNEVDSDGMISPDEILEHYDLDTPIGVCFAVLIGMYVGCSIAGYFFFQQKIGIWLK